MKSDKPQRGTGTILLAEDEPLLRELGQTILSQAGYTVIDWRQQRWIADFDRRAYRKG